MLAAGEWRDEQPGDGVTKSFLLTSLYQPLGRVPSWGGMAETWIEGQGGPPGPPGLRYTLLPPPPARPRGGVPWGGGRAEAWIEAQGAPLRLQVFVNTMLAETWEERLGDVGSTDDLSRRAGHWGGAIPAAVAA